MTHPLRLVALVTALLALPAMLPAQGLGVTAAIFRQFLVDYWDWRLADEPELATHIGVPTYDHRWRDWSMPARARARAARQEFLQRLVYIATGTLSSAERLSADLLMDDLRAELDAEPWLLMAQRVSPHDGAHNQVFDVVEQMPADTIEDYERILARIRALPGSVEQQIAWLHSQLEAGRAQPARIVDLVIEQLEAQRAMPADDSPLLAAFRRMPGGIDAADQQRLRRGAAAAYDEQFVPAWRALAAFFRETYRPAARPEVALSALPGGAEGYRALVRAYTGSPLTPEQIHQIGLEEVARIAREMARVAREAEFDGTPVAFEQSLARRDGMPLDGVDAILDYARDVRARLVPVLPRVVRLPRAGIDVRAAQAHRTAGGGLRYTAGTADGHRAAWFIIDASRPESRLAFRLEPLVLQAMAGHHAQVGRSREMEGAPAFRRAFDVPVFSNGWALYAESLGTEMGSVYRDPAARFGRLASERRHALALVVDTGIHALGWSRARAEQYLAERAPLDDASADVDWYIASPGEALTYKLGELKIRDERRRVERELGPWFDLHEFHEVVLRQGAVPLDVLEEQVTAYIRAARATVQ